jgi:glycosyltransferase involved in cell wall biosynthesis
MMMRFISIIIPVYNPLTEYVESCIDSLLNQDYPNTYYEIIIVDDGSLNNTTEYYIYGLKEKSKLIRYYKIPHKGPAVARNYGISVANGELIAFTDIDCVADSRWLQSFSSCFYDSQLGGVGGMILSYSLKTYVERYCEHFGSLRKPIFVNGKVSFLIGANSCWTLEALSKIEGFNKQYEYYSNWGIVIKGYEDFELSLRVRECGYHLSYSSSAVVYHRHRKNIRDRMRQFYSYGAGRAFFYHISENPLPILGRYDLEFPPKLRRIFGSIMSEIAALFIKLFTGRDRNMSVDQRIAYPIFDFLQRISFYAGFYAMFQRLSSLKHPNVSSARAGRV